MRQLLQSTHACTLLKAERTEGRLNHAYLLIFDDARNLKTALKEFSKIFFGADGEGADAERISRLIDEENFSDCMFFPESGKKFSVEDAERILEESALKPVEGNKKLFVAGDFAEATTQAQNKLLKLLEEPPEGVYFLLGATVSFSVLPTILSRTEKLEIPPFTQKEVTACLNRLYPGKESETGLCAAASGGSVGAAQNILEGGYYKQLVLDAFELAETDPFRLPSIVKRVGETKYKKELVSLLRLIFRDALILKTSKINGVASDRTGKNRAENYLMLKSELGRLKSISDYYGLTALITAQEALSEAEKQIRFNAVFPQCLEICMAKIIEQNNR